MTASGDLTVRVEVEIHGAYLREPPPIQIRVVEIPMGAIEQYRGDDNAVPLGAVLDLAFQYGQNDLQPQRCPSVSVGDVIRWAGHRYRVASVGFERIE